MNTLYKQRVYPDIRRSNDYRNENGLVTLEEIKHNEYIRQKSIKEIKITQNSQCQLCQTKNEIITYKIKIKQPHGKRYKFLIEKPIRTKNLLQRHHISYADSVVGVLILCPKCHKFVETTESFINWFNYRYIHGYLNQDEVLETMLLWDY